MDTGGIQASTISMHAILRPLSVAGSQVMNIHDNDVTDLTVSMSLISVANGG